MSERLGPPVAITKAAISEPCAVDFNASKYDEFLAQVGVKPEELASNKIIITTARDQMDFGQGEYRFHSKKLRLFVNNFERVRDQYLERAEDIISTGDPQDETFEAFQVFRGYQLLGRVELVKMYSGKRLAQYLATAPEQRAKHTAEKLIDTAINREINETLRHETKHMIEAARGKLSIKSEILGRVLSYGASEAVTLAAFGAFYNYVEKFDPLLMAGGAFIGACLGYVTSVITNGAERRARKFAKETSNFPNIISINPLGSRRKI
jgi:hypothetical protein